VAWTAAIGRVLDDLHPHDDVEAVWENFLQHFEQQFLNSQKEGRARCDIQNVRMKYPEIDSYIAKFKNLARLAGYQAHRAETIQLFLNGLSPNILCNIMTPPIPTTYIQAKERAIQVTRAKQLVDTILSQQGRPTRFFNPNVFGNNQPCSQPFFTQNRGGGQGQNSNWRG
jgi:hypothetical protein